MYVKCYSKSLNDIVSINANITDILKTLHIDKTYEEILLMSINLSEEDLLNIKNGAINAIKNITEEILRPTDYLLIRAISENITLEELNQEVYVFREMIKDLYQKAKKTILDAKKIEDIDSQELDKLIQFYIKK